MAEDKIIIEYEVKTAQLESSLNKVEKELKDVEASAGKSVAKVGTEAKKAGIEIDKTANKTSILKDKLADLANNLPFTGQIKQVADLAGAVVNLGGAAQKSSAGFQVLKVALASTGITILIAAIVSLIAYFKRTDEGAAKLKGVLSGMNAVLDLITGSVVEFGEAVFTALTSIDNLKSGLSDLGDFILNNLLNRIKAPIVAFEALQLAIGGDFEKATLRFLDATTQLATGITDITSKTMEFTAEAAAAAAAAFEWEQRMDALEDKMREDSKVIAENEAAITRLIIASKNKQLADEEALALLDLASKKERENVKLVLANEEAKLKLIQERNNREIASINQNQKALIDELNNEETTFKRREEIRKQLLNINDEATQEEFDQIVKIIKLKEDSANREEKINNRRDAKLEEIFQNQLKRIAEQEISEENFAKARFNLGIISAQELQDELIKIRIEGLRRQRELLIEAGRETVEIDKAILDALIQNKLISQKEEEDLRKENKAIREKNFQNELNDIKSNFAKVAEEEKTKFANGEQREGTYNKNIKNAKLEALKEEKKLLEAYGKDTVAVEQAINDQILADKEELKEKIKAIVGQGIDIAKDLISVFYDISQQKRQQDFEDQLDKSQKATDDATARLQEQLDKGLISQEQFNAKKKALDEKQAKNESALKRKQFEADKKAKLVQVAIDTAAAVVKTLASIPYPASLLASALVVAQAAAQAALIQAQPVPKFKDGVIGLKGKGTGTSDSNLAMLSKGESVMTAKETQAHRPLLESIRNNNLDDYIRNSYVLPAMKSIDIRNNRASIERADRREKKLDAILNNLNFDTSNLERSIKRNKSVSLDNGNQLAKAIAREMQIGGNNYR